MKKEDGFQAFLDLLQRLERAKIAYTLAHHRDGALKLLGLNTLRPWQDGLRDYLREKRQEDFVDNLCRKLFSYALGRGLLPSDQPALDAMRAKLAADGYRFETLVEAIVTSPQFLNKRADGEPTKEDAR